MSETVYQYICLEGTFRLTSEGRLFRDTDTTQEFPWYKGRHDKKPWIPAKRRNFVSLIKTMIREGDFK